MSPGRAVGPAGPAGENANMRVLLIAAVVLGFLSTGCVAIRTMHNDTRYKCVYVGMRESDLRASMGEPLLSVAIQHPDGRKATVLDYGVRTTRLLMWPIHYQQRRRLVVIEGKLAMDTTPPAKGTSQLRVQGWNCGALEAADKHRWRVQRADILMDGTQSVAR